MKFDKSISLLRVLAINDKHNIVGIFDKYSLSIYIIHHILIWIYLIYVPNSMSCMHEHYIIAPIILFVVIMLLSLVLSYVISLLPFADFIIGIKRTLR